MNQRTRLALAVFATTIFALAGNLQSAHAFVCPGGPLPPRCFAAPSSTCSGAPTTQCASDVDCTGFGVCNYRISGSATPGSGSILSISFLSQTNLTLSGSIPNFVVTQANSALDGQGVLQATDAGGSCTVDISFHKRALGAPVNEDVCFLQELFAVKAISGGSSSSPAGTTTCTAVLAQCDDIAPYGEDFLQPSRILTIRSPIRSVGAAPDVVTEVTRDTVFLPNLRLAFARAATPGGPFGGFVDITTSIGGGPFSAGPKAPTALTIIRGTGQWSDVKVGVAFQSGLTPTLGEWGMLILSLLLLSASSVLLTRRVPAAASSRAGSPAPPLIDAALFRKALAGTSALLVLTAAVALAWGFEPNATDLVGSLLTAGILAYLLHYWMVLARSHGPRRPH